jgi:Raf kinase inhibitor-like YbhB/YbcL family protein
MFRSDMFDLFRPVLLVSCLVIAACGDDTSSSSNGGNGGSGGDGGAPTTGGADTGGGGESTGGAPEGGSGGTGGDGTGGAEAFALTSTAITEGQTIPEVYECENGGGDNISPPLAWTEGPPGTMAYAIVMRDLDFQSGYLHWVIWDIPVGTTSLPQDVEHEFEPATPAGAKQADVQGVFYGYFGPCSPNSVNTYQWTVHAVDVATLPNLDMNSSLEEAADAVEAASIASATLSGES